MPAASSKQLPKPFGFKGGKIFLMVIICAFFLSLIGLRAGYTQIFPLVRDDIGEDLRLPSPLEGLAGQDRITTIAAWQERRHPLLSHFERDLYGPAPIYSGSEIISRTSIEDPKILKKFGSNVSVEVAVLALSTPNATRKVHLIILRPTDVPLKAMILTQNFCGNYQASLKLSEEFRSFEPVPAICDSPMGSVAKIILGKYINSPPFKTILARGYGLVLTYGADSVPDNKDAAQTVLNQIYAHIPDPQDRGGTLSVWADLYAQVAKHLRKDKSLAPLPMVAWGHSRNAKAALLAGARYDEIDIVLAHQSGRGGIAPSRSKVGESLAQITKEYDYWFSPRFKSFIGREGEISVEQHQLLALNAPKPVLITAGNRDRWSDPAGSFQAVKAASPVWELYNKPAFSQTRLRDFNPTLSVAFHMRKGTHGVTTDDWRVFLEFLDAHAAIKATLPYM